MTDRESIIATVKRVAIRVLGETRYTSNIKLESDIRNDLGSDSLDFIEMIMELEKYYNVYIPDEDMENMRIVQDMVDYLDTKLNGEKTKKLLEYK